FTNTACFTETSRGSNSEPWCATNLKWATRGHKPPVFRSSVNPESAPPTEMSPKRGMAVRTGSSKTIAPPATTLRIPMDVHLKHESYLGLLGVATLAFGSYAVSRSSRKAFAPGVNWSDLLLMGIATHKLTRPAARDRVTAPIRAPFTKPSAELDKETNPTPMNV